MSNFRIRHVNNNYESTRSLIASSENQQWRLHVQVWYGVSKLITADDTS